MTFAPAGGPLPAPRHHDDQDDGDTMLRLPPQDLEAEQSVLGGMMLSKDAIGDVLETLKSQDFYKPAHTLVFVVIVELYAKGEPADPVTVGAELTRRGEITRVGGVSYLHTLVQSVPTAANASYYAEIVHEQAVLRRLVEAGTRIAQLGYAAEGTLDEVVNRAQGELYAATETRAAAEPGSKLGAILEQAVDTIGTRDNGEITGVPTGFIDLDALTKGWQPGQLIVLGARPAVGKSTLALDFARAAAIEHGRRVLLFSLEMSKEEIGMRTLSAEARVALHHLRGNTVNEEDWERIALRVPAISGADLTVDDSPELTLADIRARARRQSAGEGLDLVIVDYLQLMQSMGTRRNGTRQEDVSELSRGLKMLAKSLRIPVIALSQLNRGPEQRTDKKPMVSDLRESGSIEQDADMVILLHREDAYDKESPRAGEADLIIGKHRNGPTATLSVAFQGHYSRFVDMAQT
ncbi:replicative DNA helicase [Streptomyces sp. 2RAF24]|uniref:replicative DNA helicase n=1 Tax=Streptomyces sp. 2RAF24 TaxID=3232997 RepID=UPI003F984247